jgi:iron complex outermembrane receptor protein
MHFPRFFFLLPFLFFVFLFSLSAQEDDLSFVVTAGRISEDSAAVPAQVTVINADDIAASGASNVVEVLKQVPGIRFTEGMSGPGSESISMRGFGENSFGRVLVLVDGKRLNNVDMQSINWNAIALSDIERIEVVDGPGSVLYGNSAVGGVINIITRKSGEPRTTIGVLAGSFFENRESFSHFRPVSWGSFSITAEHTGTEGYRDRQAAQAINATAQGTIDLTEKTSLTLQSSWAYLDYQLPGGLSKGQYKANPTKALGVYTNLPVSDDENSEKHFSGGLSLQWFINDIFQVELPLSYKGKFIESDMASSYNPAINGNGSYSNRNIHSGETRPQVSANFDLADMYVRLLGGVDLYYALLDNTTYSDKPRNAETFSSKVSEFILGPYISVRFDPLSNLTFTAGTRFDSIFITAEKASSLYYDSWTSTFETAPAMDETKTYTAFVYDAGISFRPIEPLKIYAKYATLFRYPFTDELASFYGTTMDSFNEDLDPEKGFTIEGGITLNLGNLINVNGNLYYFMLKDELYLNPITGANENMEGKTRRIGSNINVEAQPVSFLKLNFAYSWVNTRITDGLYKGRHIPLVPSHTFYGSLTGILPFGLSFGPTVEYRSKSYQGGDLANDQEQLEFYVLYGAFLRYAFEAGKKSFAIQVNADNLLDTRYTNNVFYDGYGTSAYYPGTGRTITVSALYRF